MYHCPYSCLFCTDCSTRVSLCLTDCLYYLHYILYHILGDDSSTRTRTTANVERVKKWRIKKELQFIYFCCFHPTHLRRLSILPSVCHSSTQGKVSAAIFGPPRLARQGWSQSVLQTFSFRVLSFDNDCSAQMRMTPVSLQSTGAISTAAYEGGVGLRRGTLGK